MYDRVRFKTSLRKEVIVRLKYRHQGWVIVALWHLKENEKKGVIEKKMSDRESSEVQQWQQQQQPQEEGNKEEKEEEEEAAERIDSDYFVTKEIEKKEEAHQRHLPNYFPNITNGRLPARAKYRSRVDIAAAILRVATEGAKMSMITSHAYVSYPHIKEYMTFLLDNDLLYYNSGSRKYYTTEKGLQLLKMYEECKMIFNPR